MEASTQPSTRGSRRGGHAEQVHEFVSEDSASQHSFASVEEHVRDRRHVYLSTSLVTGSNITLADVIVEECDLRRLHERIIRATTQARDHSNTYGIVDPRAILKQRNAVSYVVTMVEYERVSELAVAAERLLTQFTRQRQVKQRQQPLSGDVVLRHLMARVSHDHSARSLRPSRVVEETKAPEVRPLINRRQERKRLAKERDKARLEEACFLMNEAQVPLSNISRRLKLSRRTLQKLRKAGAPDVRVLTKTPSRGGRFSRFHDRAVALLREMLDEAKHPLTLREMQAELVRQCGLRVSRPWLSRFLRERLDATFRLVKPISQL